MVSTHLKNISQIGSFPQVGMNIKNIWNHPLEFTVVVCNISLRGEGPADFIGSWVSAVLLLSWNGFLARFGMTWRCWYQKTPTNQVKKVFGTAFKELFNLGNVGNEIAFIASVLFQASDLLILWFFTGIDERHMDCPQATNTISLLGLQHHSDLVCSLLYSTKLDHL